VVTAEAGEAVTVITPTLAVVGHGALGGFAFGLNDLEDFAEEVRQFPQDLPQGLRGLR
jgi:hypothetical protein